MSGPSADTMARTQPGNAAPGNAAPGPDDRGDAGGERGAAGGTRGGRGGPPGGGHRGNYTEGDVEQHVRRLSAFMMLGFLAMTLAQFIEAIYLGSVGTDELAAVAFTFPLTLGLNAMVRGIGIGASAVVARTIGSGDTSGASRLISHCLLLVLGFAFLFVVAALLWSNALFHAMGAPAHVAELATLYTHIWFIGFPMFAVSMVGTGLIRSVGDAAYPGYVMTLGSVLQVVIAPFLIFGWLGLPALGIAGAGWAFVIARAISCAMTWRWFMHKRVPSSRVPRSREPGRRGARAANDGSEQPVHAPADDITLTWSLHRFRESSRAILHVGLPSVFTNLVPSIASGIVTAMLANFGHAVVAGFGVASRVEALVSMVVIAISSSTGPMVGQNWGAGRLDRVHASLRICYRYSLAWGVLAGVIMLLCGRFFVSLINSDPALVETATSYLHIVPFSIGFMGVMAVASSSFNALGKPVPPLVLSLARMLVVYVPVAWLASQWFGYIGIFWATAAANVVMGVLAWQWNRSTLAREIRLRPPAVTNLRTA